MDFRSALLARVRFEDCEVRRCDFSRGDLRASYSSPATLWEDCVFDRVKLSRASVGGQFLGCTFRQVGFSNTGLYENTLFEGCEFEDCTFHVLDGVRFRERRFRGDLTSAVFTRSALLSETSSGEINDMRGVDFSDATLKGVDFRGGVDLGDVVPPARDHIFVRDWPARMHRLAEQGARSSSTEESAELNLFVELWGPATNSKVPMPDQQYKIFRVADIEEDFPAASASILATLRA